MRRGLEAWLQRRWYGGVAPGPGLLGLSWLYRGALAAREAVYRSGLIRSQRVDVPVVVIGNFTVGGTGKTPLIIGLAQALRAQGWRPGVISRGYGRSSSTPVRVASDTSPSRCGDEPRLIYDRTGLPVQVDRDRVAAARSLIADSCDLILADDGLQHRRLARDVEIEVIDGERRYGNGRLLPAGPLREAPRPCNFRVVNGETANEGEWSMWLKLGPARSLADGNIRRLADFIGRPVHAVAGIGNPDRYFAALRKAGLDIVAHPFPDHHAYAAEDLRFDGPILMTEKDAVKCRTLPLPEAWSVGVDADLPAALIDTLAGKLESLRHERA